LDALNELESGNYNFVILDISLPGMSGLDVLKNLRTKNKETRVLILSMHPEEQYAVRSLKLGASGYVNKSRAGEDLLTAIKKISSGGKYISSELAEYMAFNLNAKSGRLLHENLSEREFQIMLLLARGRSVKEIATELFIRDNTVGSHRSRILEKMGMKKRNELVFYAIQNRLVE